MKLKAKIMVLFFLLSVFFLLHCSVNKEARIDQLFRPYQGHAPGAALMVIHKGHPILIKTYGLANLKKGTAVFSYTNFRLASVTKQFTAMCIMMLKERGQLNYSTTLGEIFPDFPAYGKNITIMNLLHHTSGLLAYEDLIPDTTRIQVLDKDVLHLMMKQDSTYFPAGTAYRYSNTGYTALAMIIEKVSGQSFAEFLKENIFKPLGMKNTVAFEKGISTVSHRAYGYTADADTFRFTDQSTYSAVLGDGGIYSSLDDLFKWDQALYTNTLVSPQSLKLAFTPALKNYGFGWRIDYYKNHYRVHHTGSSRGFRTVIQRFPKDGLTIIILTNRNDPGVAPLAEKIADLYLP